jgi:hypothetical protein
MPQATTQADVGLTHVQALNASLVELRDALEQALIHVDLLLATERGHTYNPESGVMLQLADARRLAKFRAFTGGAVVTAEGADALVM